MGRGSQTAIQMKYDEAVQKTEIECKKINLDERTAEELVKRYGPYAATLVNKALFPRDFCRVASREYAPSRATVEGILTEPLTNAQIAKICGTTEATVESSLVAFNQQLISPETVLSETQRANMRSWCRNQRINLPADDTIKKMVEKYGIYAYDLMKSSMSAPNAMMKNMGLSELNSSKKTLEYLLNNDLTAEQITAAIKEKKNISEAEVSEIVSNLPYARTRRLEQHQTARRGQPASPASSRQPTTPARRQTAPQTPRQQTASGTSRRSTTSRGTSSRARADTHTTVSNIQRSERSQRMYTEYFGNRANVTFNDLASRAGVTAEDLQAVYNSHPEIAQKIGGGATCRANSRNVEAGTSLGTSGKCMKGAQYIMPRDLGAGNNATAYARYKQDRPELARAQGGDNGGCAGWYVLDSTGRYVSIAVENKCYGHAGGGQSQVDLEMTRFVKGIQPGCVVCWDAIEDPSVRINNPDVGARGQYSRVGTPGGRWGHIVVKGQYDRAYGGYVGCSDHEQRDYNHGRYGEYLHVSFPRDANIPQEYATLLIEAAKKRQDYTHRLAMANQNTH